MIDLERQIRDYYDRIVIPVTTDEYTQLATGRSIPHRQNRAWALVAAFVVVLVGFGVTILVWGGNGTSFVDQPETTAVTSAPVSEPPTTTVTHDPTGTTAAGTHSSTGWERVAAGEPWVESIIDIEAIPGGGFVVLAEEPWSVFWSPDGFEWLDADPSRQVTPYQSGSPDGPTRTGTQAVAATDDRVVVLDQRNTGLWVGDPQTGVWEQIRFDTNGFAGEEELLALASNHRGEVLVVAAAPFVDQYLVWFVDPNSGTVERHPLPIVAHGGWVDDTMVEWFNGRWVIYLARQVQEEPGGRTEDESLLVSPNGVSWTKIAAPDDWGMSLTSLTAGSTTMVATVCHFGGDSFWYSDDGLNWTKGDASYIGHHSAYSDELGFVVVHGGETPMRVSPDGQSWRTKADTPLSGVVFLEASGDTLLVGDGLRADEAPGLWLWTSD